MSAAPVIDAAMLATITVTFNPDLALLESQLRTLPQACAKFVVDNASRADLFAAIQSLARALPNVCVLRNDANLGLAAAINLGAKAASERVPLPRFVLLLDQDSEPQPGSVGTLIKAFHDLDAEGRHVGCVGPLLRDPDAGLTHGFHQCTRWRWKRVYPLAGSSTPVRCTNLNGSGTLVPISLFLQLGGLDELLFIDHVDTDWAFRVLASGRTLWGVPNALFDHRMGVASIRFWWFGWHLWPSRSPLRHYYLFRNAVVLMRRSYVLKVWKFWAVVKLAVTAGVTVIFVPGRMEQVRNMLRGVWDGLRRQWK